jgi:hypothetical protein
VTGTPTGALKALLVVGLAAVGFVALVSALQVG